MNKYERALEILSASEQQAWKEGYDVYDLQEVKDLLKELVEKATPKKPTFSEEKYEGIFNDRVQLLVCPICKRRMRYFNRVRYCPFCGQALSWDEEKEDDNQ